MKISEPTVSSEASVSNRLVEFLFLLLVASVPIMRPIYYKFSGLLMVPADVLFVLVMLAGLYAFLKGVFHPQWFTFCWFLLAYLFSMVLSVCFSDEPGRSAVKLTTEIYLIVLCFLAFHFSRSFFGIKRIFRYWLFGTTITVIVGVPAIALFYAGIREPAINIGLWDSYGSLPPGNYPRLVSLFHNPSMLCGYLIVSLLITLTSWKLGWLTPIQTAFLIGGITPVAVFTGTPGVGGFFLAAGIWTFFFLKERGYRFAPAVCLFTSVVISVVIFIGAVIYPETSSGSTRRNWSNLKPSMRVLLWTGALDTFIRNPVVGRGLGLDVTSVDYVMLSGRPQRLTNAHNVWLSIGGQQGSLGIISFAAILIFVLKKERPDGLKINPSEVIRSALTIALIGTVLYHGLFTSVENTRHIWLLIGLLAGLKYQCNATSGENAGLTTISDGSRVSS
jgi:hypothetical protein